jgi:hypothetical protein
MVSGGNVLVQISVPSAVPLNTVTVALNGRDITTTFRPGPVPGALLGLLEGLVLGDNTLTAKAGTDGRTATSLKLVNHPLTGPVFSGPHQKPFICQTETFELPVTGGTLGRPLDANCSSATRVDYVYKSAAGELKPMPDLKVRPADVVQTTTSHGRTVNYIVRIETGTINRAIYQIAMLHDPLNDPPSDPWHRPGGWNGRLMYLFGGGCRISYRQGTLRSVDVRRDDLLSKGYAAASSTFNIWNENCNDVTSAETLMMVKEHFIERFGPPVHTMGTGGSGGAMQVHLIAQNYPGLLDGIIPTATHPDIVSYLALNVVDTRLLDQAFNTSKLTWTLDQKSAVGGFINWDPIATSWFNFSHSWIMPTKASCDPVVPASLIYDPVSNPRGVRCDLYENMINLFGRDPKTGAARRPLDNVGVQYGLVAFNAGMISAEQFLDLNERIGGYDADGNIVATRTVADREPLRLAYWTGRLQSGSGGLAYTPIINVHVYAEPRDHHSLVDLFMTRARLVAANGDANNQVSLLYPASVGPITTLPGEVIQQMDRWLDNLASDPAQPSHAKVVRHKPAGLVDACFTEAGEKIAEPATSEGRGRCNQLYPAYGNPRQAAGGTVASDILKCQLKPIDPKDYVRPVNAEQSRRLTAIFPQGVCDYTRPGVEQQGVQATWLSYPLSGPAR